MWPWRLGPGTPFDGDASVMAQAYRRASALYSLATVTFLWRNDDDPKRNPGHRECDNPPTDQEGRSIDIVNVVLVGLDQDLGEELASDEAFEVQHDRRPRRTRRGEHGRRGRGGARRSGTARAPGCPPSSRTRGRDPGGDRRRSRGRWRRGSARGRRGSSRSRLHTRWVVPSSGALRGRAAQTASRPRDHR